MGYDASCRLTFGDRTEHGTAYLEHNQIVFRGPNRLVVPLKDVTDARAEDGTLHVAFAGKRAAFAIGAAAARWAKRITNPPSRLDKLGVKPGMRIALVGVRDRAFEQELDTRGVTLVRRVPATAGGVDLLFFAANTRDDLTRFADLAVAIAPNGALWVLRPKGKPEISEADTMAAGKQAGLVDVKVVSFSETHTAEKFVVPRNSRPRRPAAGGIIPVAQPARSRRSSSL